MEARVSDFESRAGFAMFLVELRGNEVSDVRSSLDDEQPTLSRSLKPLVCP